MVSQEQFDLWVNETIVDLPPFFKDRIENVLFVVEDKPDASVKFSDDILGLYEGIPLPERSVSQDGFIFPDVITLYKKNIEAISRNEDEIKQQIKETVWHELGHYFGLDENQMDEIERQWDQNR